MSGYTKGSDGGRRDGWVDEGVRGKFSALDGVCVY